MTCVFIGDSIATGVAQYRPECANRATVGVTSRQTYQEVQLVHVRADQVIVSVGANDQRVVTAEWANRLRASLSGKCVVWLLPNAPEHVRKTIGNIAAFYHDVVIDTRPWTGSDRVHPSTRGYQQLAAQTQAAACTSKDPVNK